MPDSNHIIPAADPSRNHFFGLVSTFELGPAAGISLDLTHAPKLLRVVRDARGNFDALNMLDDVAEPTETISVYIRQGRESVVFLDYRSGAKGGRRAGHRGCNGRYMYWPKPPADGVLRDNELWQEYCRIWAMMHPEAAKPEGGLL